MSFGANKTAGGANPLSLAQYKEHLRITGTEHDADISAKMAEALAYCEGQTGRQFTLATWELSFDRFPPSNYPQLLPFGNLVSVDSIVYTDTGGTSQTINAASIATDYKVSTTKEPGRIAPIYGTVWPETRKEPDAVLYTIQCGKAAALVDPEALALLKYELARLFRNREPTKAEAQSTQALINALTFDDFVRYDPQEAPKP